MTASVQEIKVLAATLSADDRAELVDYLLTAFPTSPDVEEAWNDEIARRVEEIKSGKALGKPGEQVFAEIRERRR